MAENAKKEEEVKETTTEETVEQKPMQFGVAPSLIINMVRENRVYRFEMPIGAKLDECKEACLECVNVVDKMIEEAKRKQEEAEKEADKKEESESANEDSEKIEE